MKRVVVVLGTRPEAIKLAPLISEFRSKYTHHIELVVVSTGQHYEMLRQSLEAFSQNIDVSLDLMIDNQDPSNLFILAFDAISTQLRIMNPVDMVVVQGDTTTTLAAAIAAGYQGIDLAHVEAGLRTYNLKNPHPEEINRKVVDSFSKLNVRPHNLRERSTFKRGCM
ncbi:hypothetical protein AKO1_013915 [Acrasis kona]|uniref:UDP-N-acetylglucosamine 2-epimerase (non-hydrolyzing) n=1 Tax=Acrasis kona TaxID=1008807 RepID=A0AAW2Z4U0_9EUKA